MDGTVGRVGAMCPPYFWPRTEGQAAGRFQGHSTSTFVSPGVPRTAGGRVSALPLFDSRGNYGPGFRDGPPGSAPGAKRKPGEQGRGRAGPSGFLERPRGGGPGWEGRIPTLGGRAPALRARRASRVRPPGGSIAQRRIPTEPSAARLGPGTRAPRAPALGEQAGGRGGRPSRGAEAPGDSQMPAHGGDAGAPCRSWRDGARTPGEGAKGSCWVGCCSRPRGDGEDSRGGSATSLLGVSCRVSNLTLPPKKIPSLVGTHRTSSSGCLSIFSPRLLFMPVLISAFGDLSWSLAIPPGPSSRLFSPALPPPLLSTSACLLLLPSLVVNHCLPGSLFLCVCVSVSFVSDLVLCLPDRVSHQLPGSLWAPLSLSLFLIICWPFLLCS